MTESGVAQDHRSRDLALLGAGADLAQETGLPALAERTLAVTCELSAGGGEVEFLDRDRVIARAARGDGPFVATWADPPTGAPSVRLRLARALDGEAHAAVTGIVRIARVAAERIALAERAERSARERREIVSMISHDLRTPLQTFAMGLDAIRLGAGPSLPKLEPTLGRLKRSMDTMTRTIGEVVDVSRVRDGALAVHFAPCAIETLIAALRAEHEPAAAKKGLLLETEVEPAIGLTCDRERLGQALGHLLSNAIRHAEKGAVRLTARRTGDRARFEVADAGPGVAPEVQARLFERLYRADPGRSGGVGLGLFLVRGIAEAHGGTSGVESEPGKGATFWIELPLTPTITPRD